MKITLTDLRRADFTGDLQNLFQNEFDQSLSEFQASEIIDLFLKTLGPSVYNQAVQDVRAHLQARLNDLDGEIYADVED
jgi:uncharacterized protein (DUF2164 family)